MFFFFLAGHALADYPLQTGAMATCKCRHANLPLQKDCPWYYWMAAHALVHGGTVGVLVRWFGYTEFAAVWLGVAEALVHFLIDSGKCERWYGMAIDQSLHLLCKALWCLLLLRGLVA